MKRSLTAALVVLLALALTACGGKDGGSKAGSKAGSSSSASPSTDLPTDLPTDVPSECLSELPTEVPTDGTIPSIPAGCIPSGLPTEVPSDLPTDAPTDAPSQAGGGALDGCSVVSPDLITADLGVASAGQALPQDSSYGDPNARDCYYFGGAATIVVQATTRADADLPADANSYEGVPGAIEIEGADRGWAFTFSGDSGSTTGGMILVKGQNGLNVTVALQGSTYTVEDLQKLADDLLPKM